MRQLLKKLLPYLGGIAIGAFGYVAGSLGKQKAKKQAYNEGYQHCEAKYAPKFSELEGIFQKQNERILEQNELETIQLALFAVAISLLVEVIGNEIDPEIKINIEEFIAGITFHHASPGFLSQINLLWNNPPNFNTAMEYVNKINDPQWTDFDEMIEIVSQIPDQLIPGKKESFSEAWSRYKANAV